MMALKYSLSVELSWSKEEFFADMAIRRLILLNSNENVYPIKGCLTLTDGSIV